MNISYQIYQAERPQSIMERREADLRAGEVAAAFARLGRSLRHRVTGGHDKRWTGQAPAIETISCTATRSR